MATDPSRAVLVQTVRLLASTLNAKYVNFFDSATLHNLSLPYGQQHYLIPTGSLACGEWRPGDDISLICMSEISVTHFWAYFAEKTWLNASQTTALAQTTNVLELTSAALLKLAESEPPLVVTEFVDLGRRIDYGPCRVYLHYCRTPPKYDPAAMAHDPIPKYESELYLPEARVHNLNMVRDVQCFAADIASPEVLKVFGGAYRHLRRWAEFNGIYGPNLGFLGSECLLWLTHKAYVEDEIVTNARQDVRESALIQAVLDILSDLFGSANPDDATADIDLTISTPSQINVSSNLTPEAKRALLRTVKDTHRCTGVYAASTTDPATGLRYFIQRHDPYFMINTDSWALKASEHIEFQSRLVPAKLNMLVQHCRAENVPVRLWPHPVRTEPDMSQAVYAAAILPLPRRAQTDAELRVIADDLSQRFMEENADRTSTFSTVTLAPKSVFEEILRQSSRGGSDQSPPQTSIVYPPAAPANTSTRFRPAGEAMARLFHDPKHAAFDYDVWYMDRFLPDRLRRMPLEDWRGKRPEDLDWVPEHRVRKLIRRVDGVVVWDREGRVDLL